VQTDAPQEWAIITCYTAILLEGTHKNKSGSSNYSEIDFFETTLFNEGDWKMRKER